MALFLSHKEPLYRWGVWKMDESVDTLLDLLPEREYYEREVQRFVASHRRLEWLSVRALLFRLLGEHKEVCYQPSGKPYLADYSYFISISHTKGYAAVLLQNRPAAGIDIEYHSGRVSKIRSRFMNPEEEAGIDKEHETEHLLLHWCAKETLFKMIGQEEVDFLHHLHVRPFPYAEEGSFTVYETRTEEGAVYRLDYLVTPDFVLTRS